jgi:MULE transposase domain/SWIM zinc finger
MSTSNSSSSHGEFVDAAGPGGHSEGRADEQGVMNHSRCRAVWTAQKSVHPSMLDAELEEFGPLSKCETKSDKTYYRCPFQKRFKCPIVIRTFREIFTGHIIIESRGSSHSHEESNEHFLRGLSNAVKNAIEEVTKYNLSIRPKALQRALITGPFNFSIGSVDISKITSYLHRVRRNSKSSYDEHTVAGLWNAVNSRQFHEDSSDWSSFFFTITADQAIVDAGLDGARVQTFATTRSLLENVGKVSASAAAMQAVLDSKHRILMNNYPVTALGVLDAGQQFNLVALAVSNKEDEELYTSLIMSVQTIVQALGITLKVECTMSDNCDAIQNAFQNCFPLSLRGNCNFHLQQNIKKKRGLWQVTVPASIPANRKNAFVVRARNEREAFTQDFIRWISSLQSPEEFSLASQLFLAILRDQGDQAFSDTLSKEYFEGHKRGWARSFTTRGSATTNNALESFNGNVLARDIAAGSRMTIAQLYEKLEGLFAAESALAAAGQPPLTSMDVRPCVRAKSHMKARVHEWFAKAIELSSQAGGSFVPLYVSDGNGGFFWLSSTAMRQNQRIDTVLASRSEVNIRCDNASSDARSVLEDDQGGQDGGVQDDGELRLRALKMLREAIDLRDTTFYHVRLVSPDQNIQISCARAEAQRLASDQMSDSVERSKASDAINSGRFLYFGALTHTCSCPGFMNYGACKHALWATMETTGEGPPAHVDPRALATRRRAGRPRGAGRALQILPPSQDPLV